MLSKKVTSLHILPLCILFSASLYAEETKLLDATQYVFENKHSTFQVGYKLKNGETITHVLRSDLGGQLTNDSVFEDSIFQITDFAGQTYAIQMDGESFMWTGQGWQVTDFDFDMLTKIISHDQNLVYCSATFPSKAMMNQGRCMGEGWETPQNVFWYDITPEICDNELWVVEPVGSANQLKQFDRFSGKLIKTRSIRFVKPELDVCTF